MAVRWTCGSWFSVVILATSFLIQSLLQKLQENAIFLMTRSHFLPVLQLIVGD